MGQPGQVFTPHAREQFLEHIRKTANVSAAARLIGISRTRVYQLREEDESLRKVWDEAISEGIDDLEAEARRRAFDGVNRPVFQGGECVGHVREYSDTLMTLLLKGNLPRKYREQLKIELPPAAPRSHRFVPGEAEQHDLDALIRDNGRVKGNGADKSGALQ